MPRREGGAERRGCRGGGRTRWRGGRAAGRCGGGAGATGGHGLLDRDGRQRAGRLHMRA
ncbi:hypothetical protein FM110_13640 [Brachybacterium nesterenkovii]|uniref:Uncharacterized protein n=1 Tax=Brachybacterium nesterenkovii TaxID=47847 RepID=A0A1X6XA09_9MICO|nr:hypothetical protein FM110_13640 [Brachybacterium nesterenkovii]